MKIQVTIVIRPKLSLIGALWLKTTSAIPSPLVLAPILEIPLLKLASGLLAMWMDALILTLIEACPGELFPLG